MINREDLNKVHSILSLSNKDVNIDSLYNVLTAIKEDDTIGLLDAVYSSPQDDIDISLLKNVFTAIKYNPSLEHDLLDSFSSNQVASKYALIDAVNNLNILDKDSIVVIWGSWYGSILIPSLADKVKKIVAIDLDDNALQIAKTRLFRDYNNINYVCDDIFKTYRDVYLNTNLIINTSCEHMPPMKEWKWFGAGALETDINKSIFKTPKLPNDCYFVFQSNNMFGIEGHVNCVSSLQEFKDQLPERAEVLYEEEVEDTRGTRYMLVGKFMPL